MRLPLRVRVTLASAASAALILAALSFFVYASLRGELIRAAEGGLRARAEAVASALASAGGATDGNRGSGDAAGQAGIDIPDVGTGDLVQVLTPDGRQAAPAVSTGLTGSATVTGLPAGLGVLAPLTLSAGSLRAIRGPEFLLLPPRTPGGQALRAYVLPTTEGRRLFVLVGSSMAEVGGTLDRLRILLVIAGPAAFGLACLAAWVFAGEALRPVERMRREAAAISMSAGSAGPGPRLSVPDTSDEIARLGQTLNSLLDRLRASLDREQRLLDDASHELRTPLSILKAELDLTLTRVRAPAELEAALRSASEETDRLARLAEDLLVLSRTRAAGLDIHRRSTSLRELLDRACAGHLARVSERGTRIECSAPQALVPIDPMRLRQAVDNLLDNAIRHGQREGGRIRVEAAVAGQKVTITVQNSGQGFAASLLPRAFEPFVQGQPGSPGAGLGLAIVAAVAEAHGGTATAENVSDGVRLTMTLAL